MSDDYLIDPLFRHKHDSDQVASEINPANINRMKGILRTVPLRVKIQRFIRARKLSSVFNISCLILLFIFSIVLYYNIDYAINFFVYINPSALFFNLIGLETTDFAKNGLRQTIIDRRIKYHDFNYLKAESLTYENRTYENNLKILFRFPKKRKISSILLIFHGCGRSAYEWFHTIERQRIMGGAIDLGYACLAFQAADQSTRCWSSDTDLNNNEDAQRVSKALEYFYKEYPNLVSLPRFTFGASSGGMFSSIYAINQRWTIQGQVIFISIVVPNILHNYVKSNKYPPTAWIYMTRDTEFASESRINASIRIFAQEKIPHIVFNIKPIAVVRQTFNERIPTINRDTSNYISYRLQQNHWLDSKNYLIYNPRHEESWRKFLFETNNETIVTSSILKNLRNHENIVAEFLNTIYGEHEISYERTFEAFTWLQTQLNRSNAS